MEREIKFEYGFESVNGIVRKVYHIHEIQNIKEICDVWNLLPFVYRRQFTGLKDKNGKDIYEGDVINAKGTIAKIEFMKPDLCFGFWHEKYQEWYSLSFLKGLKDFEVIGNIYEAPELLKKAVTDVS